MRCFSPAEPKEEREFSSPGGAWLLLQIYVPSPQCLTVLQTQSKNILVETDTKGVTARCHHACLVSIYVTFQNQQDLVQGFLLFCCAREETVH